ncbi:hypothetical protein GY12_05080 [Micrococcus luteus]|nr:hypothetical protein GY12_14915 [Micrococcus luteus]KFC52454.1 hypothetical protein GY12_05080 [Micrococcus luteus]
MGGDQPGVFQDAEVLQDCMTTQFGQGLSKLGHALAVAFVQGIEQRPPARMGQGQEDRVVVRRGHVENDR